MHIIPIKTRKFLPPRDDLFALLNDYLPRLPARSAKGGTAQAGLRERDIVVITSKVLAIHQGRCRGTLSPEEKKALVEKEAEYVFKPSSNLPYVLTVKGHTIIGGAGIDESNGNGYTILWPTRISRAAKEVWTYLRRKHRMKRLGILITDSHCIPLRRGTLGIAIGLFGFRPVKNNIGQPDIFGRRLRISRSDLADSLAAAAVLVMGEGNEQTPLALIRNAPGISFTTHHTFRSVVIAPTRDLYYPLLKSLYEKQPTSHYRQSKR